MIPKLREIKIFKPKIGLSKRKYEKIARMVLLLDDLTSIGRFNKNTEKKLDIKPNSIKKLINNLDHLINKYLK